MEYLAILPLVQIVLAYGSATIAWISYMRDDKDAAFWAAMAVLFYLQATH